jgi:hypothetical protein
MDIEKLTKETILKNMNPEQQKAVLDSVMASVQESKKVRSQKVAENVDLVMQALKKIEAQMLSRVDKAATTVETVAKNVKDGKDGRDGKDGKAGKDGVQGPKGVDGRDGKAGKDGKDGRDGVDGVSVVNAFLDFDNSLVIELSNGHQINVGGILADDTADKVRVVANGGGTSQGVLDALAALQAEIDALIPDQTGNSGKFLTTNGSDLSWASVAGGLSYQGTWNASTNSPTLASGTGTNGYYYVVATAGSTNLDGITDWQIGDWLLFNGTAWQKIDQSNLVTSVAGRTGAITLSNSDVSGSAASGANSDITSLSGITGAIGTADYVAFDTSYATTLGVGQLGWDGNNTLGLGMYGGNVVQRIGEDSYFYVKASSAITKGQVCMFTGAVGASGVVTAAPSTGVTNGQYIMGIAAESIALNGFGLVQCFGTLRNINTTGFSDGDIVYYDSAVTGGFTKTMPTSGPIVTIAAIVNGGSSGGGVVQIRVAVTQRITASTGISVSQNGTGTTITNSAPDQTVVLTAGTGISTSGTYPNFTITNSSPDQTVALTAGTGISVSGTYPNFTVTNTSPSSGGTVTSVTGTSPVVSSGGNTPAISLASGYGDTQNPYASKTANYVLAAPNGSSGVPTFRAIVAADIPTLNQNTTGSAAKWTTARTLSFTGDVTGSNTVDGSANVATSLTVASGTITQSKLASGVSGNGPAFSAYKSGNQTVSHNTLTKITFDTEAYDTNNNFASSTFTPTVAGYYQPSGSVYLTGTGGRQYVIAVFVYKNGAIATRNTISMAMGTGGDTSIGVTSPLIYMNGSTDYMELYVYEYDYSASSSMTINGAATFTQFGASLVRAA